MQSLNIKNFLSKKSFSEEFIIFGAGTIGRLIFHELKHHDLKVKCFVDSDKAKQNNLLEGIEIISPENFLKDYKQNSLIIIGHNYFAHTLPQLIENNFINIYHAVSIIEKCDYVSSYKKMDKKFFLGDLHPLKIERLIQFYCEMARKENYLSNEILQLKSIDVQITEKCSLKCKDCSNLMQYYERPVDTNQEILFKSMKRIMSVVDKVNELRVLGGDPFMNKEMYKYIDNLLEYENAQRIVIYTNARFVPKGKNLECLKNEKVILDITNYGESSKAHDDLVSLAIKEGIKYSSFRCTTWQDCGRIVKDTGKAQKDLIKQFNNCCNSDLITLLHGKLYRCPFSANLHNLNFYELDNTDEVNILDENISNDDLKKKIKNLCFDKKFLSACRNCNGRDFDSVNIPAALQTPKFIFPN